MSADFKSTWLNQPPEIFTDKVATVQQDIIDLDEFCTKQGIDIHGVALDKGTEENKLEDLAHKLGRALGSYFRDKGNQTDAAKVDFPISVWRGKRDQDLKTAAGIVRDYANTLVTDLTQTALAAKYGVTSAAVSALSAELVIWNTLIAAPQTAQEIKAGRAKLLRPMFNAISVKMHDLDGLILQFDGTATGRAMIAAWKGARIVRDLGHGAGTGAAAKKTAAATTPETPGTN